VGKIIGNFTHEWVQLWPAFPIHIHRHEEMNMSDVFISTVDIIVGSLYLIQDDEANDRMMRKQFTLEQCMEENVQTKTKLSLHDIGNRQYVRTSYIARSKFW
jgi:hypothetical protein